MFSFHLVALNLVEANRAIILDPYVLLFAMRCKLLKLTSHVDVSLRSGGGILPSR